MKNNDHDLIHQMSEKLDSLWRYDEYTKNAVDCPRCQALWKKLKEKDKEAALMLKDEIKKHMDEGRFEYCEECFIK